ncbi:MAG: hypothetical protein HXN43_08490, partial [Prevotella micans]|nr:hypothetical protein [Prevotella micans]
MKQVMRAALLMVALSFSAVMNAQTNATSCAKSNCSKTETKECCDNQKVNCQKGKACDKQNGVQC